MYERENTFLEKLKEFGVIEKGHFEYKGKDKNGNRKHGEFFVNFRKLNTKQEKELSKYYKEAILKWFKNKENLIIIGVAMGSLFLPKVIQLELNQEKNIEFAYTEKRNGELGIFDYQAEKCKNKNIIFIEDVCNNGTSTKELIKIIENSKNDLNIKNYSFIYGLHRENIFFDNSNNNFFAMSKFSFPSFSKDNCELCKKGIPLKEYKK